jgi:subtilisin family serine protease
MVRHEAPRWGGMARRLFLIALFPLILAACSGPSAPVADVATDASPATLAGPVIPGRFIVTLRDGVDPARVAGQYAVRPDYTYRHALNGFAGSMSDAARRGLLADMRVLRIEPDQVVTLSATTQSSATWGLDRIDQAALSLNGAYTYAATGSGVSAYIIDTGIRTTHNDFGSRAKRGFDAFGGTSEDCNGHGTHVAGTVGGTTYGVAKAVTLVAVRVLDCNGSGTWSGVIAGVDWVTGNAVRPAVANMSLGGGASTTVDDAVRRSIAAGVTYAVAAGNGDRLGRQQPACNYSPARVREALTVGATTNSDAKTSWSNYGECVDVFAPGASITAPWHTSNTAINTISGTSMASPHVAGVAALYLQGTTTASAAAVFEAVRGATTKGIVTSSSTAKNDLLYSRLDLVGPPPLTVNQPPVASFTASCTDLTCTFTDTSTDADGSIASRSWALGDGATASNAVLTHTYAAAQTYTVTVLVTDNGGATGSASRSVTVTAPPTGDITLSVRAYKVSNRKRADLTWSGATSTHVDVFRDNSKITTVTNSGSYTHATKETGGGSHTYRVCEAGTTRCSPSVTVTY